MLRKALDRKQDWPDQIKFCLYAIHAIPDHCTGYSLFEILHGVNSRSPVDMEVDEWTSTEKKSFYVTKWMEELNSKLKRIKDMMKDNGLIAPAKAKQQHDKNQVRQIDDADFVLLRSPGILGKLDTACNDSFEILEKVSRVNVELGLPGRTRKQAETKVLRVIVITGSCRK